MGTEVLTLWEITKSGGLLMLVLGFLSFVGVALVIYYFGYFRMKNMAPGSLNKACRSLLETGDRDGARRLCEEQRCFSSSVILAGLDSAGKPFDFMLRAMENEGARQAARLWQKLAYLYDVAVISPLVGLLGTVLGMIKAFRVVAAGVGMVKPISLAGGVSMALVTTAAGLIIAIFAMAFYSFFRGRVQDIIADMEVVTADFAGLVHSTGEKRK